MTTCDGKAVFDHLERAGGLLLPNLVSLIYRLVGIALETNEKRT